MAGVRLLASVTDPAEARIAVAGGADIIDAKNPHTGALGALPYHTVTAIRAAVPAHVPVSATIGDLPAEPDRVLAAAQAMAATGVTYVKIGFWPGDPGARATISALGHSTLGHRWSGPGDRVRSRLVGLLIADRTVDLTLIEAMAVAGFAGVMLDTADKAAGSLPDVMRDADIAAVMAAARRCGLFTGLAGALRVCHIAALARGPIDVLGFRGALCAGGVRTGPLCPHAVAAVRAELDRHAGSTRATHDHPPREGQDTGR